MKFMLTNERVRKIVKRMWDESRHEDKVIEALVEIGLTAIEGDIGKALCRSVGMIQEVIGEEFADSDEFVEDFMYGEDFEAFYAKWFEEDKG